MSSWERKITMLWASKWQYSRKEITSYLFAFFFCVFWTAINIDIKWIMLEVHFCCFDNHKWVFQWTSCKHIIVHSLREMSMLVGLLMMWSKHRMGVCTSAWPAPSTRCPLGISTCWRRGRPGSSLSTTLPPTPPPSSPTSSTSPMASPSPRTRTFLSSVKLRSSGA